MVSAHEVAAPKPAPDPYLEACRRLGVEAGPSVVALEDSPTGVAAARAAGLTVIGVPSIQGVALDEAHHLAESLLDAVIAAASPSECGPYLYLHESRVDQATERAAPQHPLADLKRSPTRRSASVARMVSQRRSRRRA